MSENNLKTLAPRAREKRTQGLVTGQRPYPLESHVFMAQQKSALADIDATLSILEAEREGLTQRINDYLRLKSAIEAGMEDYQKTDEMRG